MKTKTILIIILIIIGFSEDLSQERVKFYDYEAKAIDGQKISMKIYRGKKVLIVNVASKCGFTPQYEGLQKLHKSYVF